MITIIHGDDISLSRRHFVDLRAKSQDSVAIDGETTSLTDLTQKFEGGDLFGSSKSFFIENLFGKKKKGQELDSILSYLKEQTLHNTITVWEGRDLDKKQLSHFPHATVQLYKVPQTLFVFLDSLKPSGGKNSVLLFQKVLQTQEPEMVFYMIIRHMRILLALQDPTGSLIDEVKRLAPWQSQKMQRQSKQFNSLQLTTLYKNLYTIEKQYKTGDLPTSLTTAIDILLLQI